MALTRSRYALHVFTQLRSDIYLGIALTSTPHRPGTHHADAQSAEGDVDVRPLPGHYEEADRRDAQSRCDQPVPVRLPLHHLCNLPLSSALLFLGLKVKVRVEGALRVPLC